MDSQAIGPAVGLTASAQPPERTQPTVGVRSNAAAIVHRSADDAHAAQESASGTRDPRSLQYKVDGGTHRIVATIVDESNRTVIRQVPSEEVVRIAKAIDRMQGFLLDSKA